MHDIEPFYHWRHLYIASEDRKSPFYGVVNSEFEFTHRIYNYLIHPQWDDFGSNTLYAKVLFADYEDGTAIIEFIGEWNDCIDNDILHVMEGLLNPLIGEGIYRFVLVCENVLNFHRSDDLYYEELYEEIREEDGWVAFLNTLPHVEQEMQKARLWQYVHFGESFNTLNWRSYKPEVLIDKVESIILRPKRLTSG